MSSAKLKTFAEIMGEGKMNALTLKNIVHILDWPQDSSIKDFNSCRNIEILSASTAMTNPLN